MARTPYPAEAPTQHIPRWGKGPLRLPERKQLVGGEPVHGGWVDSPRPLIPGCWYAVQATDAYSRGRERYTVRFVLLSPEQDESSYLAHRSAGETAARSWWEVHHERVAALGHQMAEEWSDSEYVPLRYRCAVCGGTNGLREWREGGLIDFPCGQVPAGLHAHVDSDADGYVSALAPGWGYPYGDGD